MGAFCLRSKMRKLRNYLESHKNLRTALASVGFLAASLLLYMAIVSYFFIQYAGSLIACYIVLVLILDLGIGWMLHLHTRKSFPVTVLLSSAGIVVGMIVVSILVMHGHWVDVVKELSR
jgi:hypothetical protein